MFAHPQCHHAPEVYDGIAGREAEARAAAERGIEMSKDDAREIVYGMPYDEWKARYQTDASPEQQAAFKESFAKNVGEG